MHLIRFGIISFVVLFLLITGISLFIPSHIRISRAVNVKAGTGEIMKQVSDPLNWKNWYPGLDSASIIYIEGQPKGMLLDSNDREGSTLIISNVTPTEVTASFNPKSMRPVINKWQAISYPNGDSVTVQWYMDFHLHWYPWEKFGSLLLEKSHGSKMEVGLTRLRKVLQEE